MKVKRSFSLSRVSPVVGLVASGVGLAFAAAAAVLLAAAVLGVRRGGASKQS